MIAPLDPNSPRGIEAAERLTQVFAEVRLAIWERQSTPPKPGTPAPSPPPAPKPRPVGPSKNSRRAAA